MGAILPTDIDHITPVLGNNMCIFNAHIKIYIAFKRVVICMSNFRNHDQQAHRRTIDPLESPRSGFQCDKTIHIDCHTCCL